MKKISKYFLIIFSVALVNINFAQTDADISRVGTTAAAVLKIAPGARALGMGSAYVGVSDDIYSSYYNPAGITRADGVSQVAFNHSNWLADVDYDYAAGSINVDGLGTIFATFSSLRVPEDDVRTIDSPLGDGRTWDANSLVIGVGYARSLTDRFSIGFHLKYVQESIWNVSASGIALDVGTYYITPFNDLVIGASVSNFGTKMQLAGRDLQINVDPENEPESGPNNIPAQYSTEKNDLPLNFRVGLAMDVVNTRYFRLKTALDAVHPNDNKEYINAGAEFSYNEMIFLRGGYKALFLPNSEQGLTLGVGINYDITPGLEFTFNYAYGDYGRLNSIQYFDIGLIF
ncbi:MAG: PorV/PorQ family protein [Ignavibacteriae bacterium]|nr:PorV/PorQ family protein [Ignavibacteriota bacterium]MCB9210627.1 PorV/PorQ family protein [Ignavibacteriales bacterium]MCB9218771.1 PorV/PorQ family protein [Ignavibacteriales bacterium]